jgi:hypothetical protein
MKIMNERFKRMNDAKNLLPTAMPPSHRLGRDVKRARMRSAGPSRHAMRGALRLCPRPRLRSVQDQFLLAPLPTWIHSAIYRMNSSDRERESRQRDCGQSYFATLVLRHASLRILLHLIAMARKPGNSRWHLRCIRREFYGRHRQK